MDISRTSYTFHNDIYWVCTDQGLKIQDGKIPNMPAIEIFQCLRDPGYTVQRYEIAQFIIPPHLRCHYSVFLAQISGDIFASEY